MCNGDLDVWFLPYTSKITGLIYAYLSDALIPQKQYFVSSDRYTDIAGCVVDVEVSDESDSQEANAFAMWFSAKTGDFMDDYNLFMQIMPYEFIAELHKDGFEATRPKLPQAPEITQQVVPDLNSPLEKNGSGKTKKRTPKRSKNTS